MSPGLRTILMGRTWSPRDIPNVLSVYDASKISSLFQEDTKSTPITASGQTVGAFVDAVSGRDLLQSNSGKRPQYSATGLGGGPCIFGDSLDDRLVSNTFTTISQPLTFLICLKLTSPIARTIIDGDDANAPKLLVSSTTWREFAGSSVDSGVTADTTTVHLIQATYSGASSSFTQDSSAPVTLNPGTGTTSDLILLDNKGAAGPTGARVGLFVVVGGTVSSNDFARLQQYCRPLWGNP